jgi:hypothetical protein
LGRADQIDAVVAAKNEALAAAAERHPPDHMKAASGRLFSALKSVVGVQGKSSNAFMRDELAPLIVPGMEIYDELKRDVFGGAAQAG